VEYIGIALLLRSVVFIFFIDVLNSGDYLDRVTLCIEIKKDLREKMKKLKNIDWRSEIEKFIEEKMSEIKLSEVLADIDNLLKGIEPSKEPAWRSIREMRKLK